MRFQSGDASVIEAEMERKTRQSLRQRAEFIRVTDDVYATDVR